MSLALGRSALRSSSRTVIPSRALSCSLSTSGRSHSSSTGSNKGHVDVEALLSKSTWSVSSLLPPKDSSSTKLEITSKQLHHLLRLSALPPPRDAAEEAKMLSTLSSQLHFVKDIQAVDTTGVEPLQSVRDETQEGEEAAELGLEALRDALAQEEVRGKYHKRIRRRRDHVARHGEGKWDPLQTAGKKVGRYFVVEGGKEG